MTDPLTADLRRIHITVSRRFLKKLEAAKDALSHAHPDGRAEKVLEAALDLLLEQSARRKGLVKKPRDDTAAPPSGSASDARPELAGGDAARPARAASDGARPADKRRDTIPAAVRRAVWKRDEGRCQWKLDGGGTCGATKRLEIDHVHPHALGGLAMIENTRVLCRFHNQLAARRTFGDEWVDWYLAARCESGARRGTVAGGP